MLRLETVNRYTIRMLLLLLTLATPGSAAVTYDVVVYGGTSAGVMAAVQANRMDKSVIIVCPDKHLGGLSAGGLGFTDTGDKSVIGGLGREFYHRIWREYNHPETWKWQKRPRDFDLAHTPFLPYTYRKPTLSGEQPSASKP